MIFFSILAAASLAALTGIIWKNLPAVRAMTPEEMVHAMQDRFSLREALFTRMLVPACDRAEGYCVAKFYSVSEKFLRRCRISALKAESRLQKVADYLRGKRNLSSGNAGGNAEYWQTINEHQNNLKNGTTPPSI